MAKYVELPGVVIHELHKSYGDHVVLNNINLIFRPGEVHALLGPNGAGKSTLLGCLSGAVQPDVGIIALDGVSYAGFTPGSARDAGTSIIYQHFQLISELSVADNIFLGAELRNHVGTIDRSAQRRKTVELLSALAVELDPDTPVRTLSVGMQQVVEIARALHRKPKLLILDEPTAALSRHEAKALGRLVRRLAYENQLAVIYVTHLLHEVLDVADVVTIIRDGRVQWTRPTKQVNFKDLVKGIAPQGRHEKAPQHVVNPGGRALLTLSDFRCGWSGPVDLTVYEGDIIGIFGLLGSGRTDLLTTIAGARRRKGGKAVLRGKQYRPSTPRGALRAGVALVASNRITQSLFSAMTAAENVLVPHLPRLSRWRIRARSRELAQFKAIATAVQLQPPQPRHLAAQFSGGNAQKLAVGRWLNNIRPVSLLVLDEPTQGIDVGARHELYELIRGFAHGAASRAVIFATSDPEEVAALATRVIVIADGQLTRELSPDADEKELLAAAQGSLYE